MAAVLPVDDLAAALRHYQQLGFEVSAYKGGGYGYGSQSDVSRDLVNNAAISNAPMAHHGELQSLKMRICFNPNGPIAFK